MTNGTQTRFATAGEVGIAYEIIGDDSAPAVLLVSGLGGQLISWDDGICAELVQRGLRVIRFDNRDVGLSTHLAEPVGSPGPTAAPPPGFPAPSYTLSDMAADAVALLDALGLAAAHLVGVSMGGMIAQVVAIEHPDRVRSLTSIMSTTGDQTVGEATDEALELLTGPPPTSRQEAEERALLGNRAFGSPGYPLAEEVLRRRVGEAYDRAFDPAGVGHQLAAIMVSPDRTEALGEVTVPALVIHGAEDALIGVSGGRATAAAIPGAELVVIDGMGHELPEALWGRVAELITGLVSRAEQRG